MHRNLGLSILGSIALVLGAAGCQAPRSASSDSGTRANVNFAPVAPLLAADYTNKGAATVVLDLGALTSSSRHLLGLGFADTATIQQARLTAEGPDFALPVSVTATWSLTAGTAAPPATLSLVVPAGKNRVFTLEGLDAAGHTIASIRTLASVVAGATTPLVINTNTDAAARILYDLLFAMGNSGDYGGARAGLSSLDVTVKLLSYVSLVTQFDAATNRYAGQPPRWLRDRDVAANLFTKGLAPLNSTPIDVAGRPAGATYTVAVYDGGVAAGGAQVTLYDPTTASPVTTKSLGEAIFYNVPPGSWAYKATLGSKVAWGTLDAHGIETDRVSISLSPQRRAGALTAPVPTIVTTLAGDATLVSKGQAATDRDGFGNARGTLATLSPYGVAVAPDGVVYAASGNTIWKISPEGKVNFLVGPRGLVGTTANSPTTPNVSLTGVKGIVLDANGDLIVADAGANKIFKVSLANPARPTLSLLIGGGSNTYLDGPAGERGFLQFTPDTFAAFNAPGAVAVAADGTIYVADTQNNCIRKINMTDPTHPVASTLAGMVVNGTPVQGFQDSADPKLAKFSGPNGLALDKAGTTLYVADRGNLRLRTVNTVTGEVKTLAGSGQYRSTDGVGVLADFSGMYGLAFDANGLLLVSDGDAIRTVDVTTANVKKLAGVGNSFNSPTFMDGPLLQARFAGVNCLAADANGNIYAADNSSSLLRKLVP